MMDFPPREKVIGPFDYNLELIEIERRHWVLISPKALSLAEIDPDLRPRGFSEDRDSSVVVAGGTDPGNRIAEDDLRKMQRIAQLIEQKVDGQQLTDPIFVNPVDGLATYRAQRVEPGTEGNAWEMSQSTAVYVTADMVQGRGLLRNIEVIADRLWKEILENPNLLQPELNTQSAENRVFDALHDAVRVTEGFPANDVGRASAVLMRLVLKHLADAAETIQKEGVSAVKIEAPGAEILEAIHQVSPDCPEGARGALAESVGRYYVREMERSIEELREGRPRSR